MRLIKFLSVMISILLMNGSLYAQVIGIMTTPPGSFTHSAGSAIAKVIVERVGLNATVQPFISAAMIGYANRPLGISHRILFWMAGFSLLIPMGILKFARLINFFGILLAVILISEEIFFQKRKVEFLKDSTDK